MFCVELVSASRDRRAQVEIGARGHGCYVASAVVPLLLLEAGSSFDRRLGWLQQAAVCQDSNSSP